mgnify:CR=1 FL=1
MSDADVIAAGRRLAREDALRFGALKTWLVAVTLIIGLRAIGLPVLGGLLGFVWLALWQFTRSLRLKSLPV